MLAITVFKQAENKKVSQGTRRAHRHDLPPGNSPAWNIHPEASDNTAVWIRGCAGAGAAAAAATAAVEGGGAGGAASQASLRAVPAGAAAINGPRLAEGDAANGRQHCSSSSSSSSSSLAAAAAA
jgi:hypothetical protein